MYCKIIFKSGKGKHAKSNAPLPFKGITTLKKCFWHFILKVLRLTPPQEVKITCFTKMTKGFSLWLYDLHKTFEVTCENILFIHLIVHITDCHPLSHTVFSSF